MPLQVSGAFHTPFMAPCPRPSAQGDRRGRTPRDTDVPGGVERRRAGPRPRADWASLLSAQLSQPGALEALSAHPRRAAASPTSPSSAPGRADGHGQAYGRPMDARSRCRPPRISTSCSSGSTPARRRPPVLHEGEHLFAVERLVVSPAAGVFTPIGSLTEGSVITVGTVHRPRRRHRGPFAVRGNSAELHRPRHANGSHHASRSPGCAVTGHDERGELTRCQQYRTARVER